MRLSSFLRASQIKHRQVSRFVRGCWNEIMADSASVEYKQWRYHFIVKRLYLMTWVSIVVMAIGQLVDWIIPLTSLDLSGAKYDFYRQHIELTNKILLFGWFEILFTFILLKVAYARKYPILILLWLTWTLLISHQVITTIFLGQIRLDGYGWIMVLSAGPILMPVKWRSHCFCQLVVLTHFALSHFVFGVRDPFADQIEYFNAIYVTVVVCAIVNYAVFLYERFLRQEFELKQQLRLFLHTVSHDLRSPVLGSIFLLKSLRNSVDNKTVIANEILDRMVDSSDRQLRLIDSLLEAHNTETKGIILHPRPACINNLVQSVITDMQPFFDRQQAVVTTKIPAKFMVDIDTLQIRRVYENLINNALEYNRSGLHLTLEVDRHCSMGDRQNRAKLDRWLYCSVSDDGIGIAPHKRFNIFELYSRAASSKQSLNVGLGLYICRQIINAHGGEIGVNNTQTGASFWFTLPIAKTNNFLKV